MERAIGLLFSCVFFFTSYPGHKKDTKMTLYVVASKRE
jgi:hypothetical protein